jgi:hypothetical protein
MWYILWGTLQVLFQSNVSAMGFQGSACGACDGEAAHTSTFESAHTHMRVIYCNKVCVMQFLMGVRMHVWVWVDVRVYACVNACVLMRVHVYHIQTFYFMAGDLHAGGVRVRV